MVNNQGIMHAAHRPGGQPFCKNRNAHMSTTIENYLKEPKPCKRCMPTVQKQLALKAKGVKMPAAFEKTTDADIAKLTGIKPYPFQSGLIIHVNSFTGKIEGGYRIEHGRKIGSTMTPIRLNAYRVAHSNLPVYETKI